MIVAYGERIAFFKYISSMTHFKMVQDLCEYFQKNQYDCSNKIYDHLVISLYTIYAKPFKQRMEIRLEEKYIPEAYREFHYKIIKLRDKFSAHTDLDFDISAKTNEFIPMNEVIANTKDGQTIFGISIFKLNSEALNILNDLSSKLRNICEEEALLIWKRYFTKTRLPDGLLMINVGKEDGSLLVEHSSSKFDLGGSFYTDITRNINL